MKFLVNIGESHPGHGWRWRGQSEWDGRSATTFTYGLTGKMPFQADLVTYLGTFE